MTGLSDMEELLGRIENKAMVDYMREAIGCYHAGAYRGCIVLSYIALFDDIGEKLHELAKMNKTARTISKDVKQRQEDQQVFETYMVDQLKAAKLLTEPEASMLEQVRVCRNKAAHPSGVHASPEEARFVFFEVIDKFLSKPLLLTTQAVDALMGRLGNTNFFPSNDITETKDIVQNELAGLHAAAFPYLTEKLVGACNESSKDVARNTRRFLVGLSYLQQDDLTDHIRKRLVKEKADDTDFSNLIVRVASANPRVLDGHDKTTLLRLRSVLDSAVEDVKPSVAVTQLSHPVYLLGAMLDILGTKKVLNYFKDFAEGTALKYRYSGTLVQLLNDPVELKNLWLSSLKEDAGSSTFDTANRFASNLPDIDELLPNLIKPKDAFELVVAVCRAADWGAFLSQGLRSNRFSAVPKLRDMAIQYSEKDPKSADKMVKGAQPGKDLDEFVDDFLKNED
ncbi:hypothetical protein [Thalassospira tepidiphila]|uniref:hypothetical protein n=1 Tax=Thalassospira tepidiphila TaxID=393657 RepID=UPI00291D2E53|nr:hypothetical protein MACH01_14170 [Thalassospira tepidiphila]